MSAETSVYLGTGRRKTSTARVRLVAGSGQLSVNDRKFEVYFTHDNFVRRAVAHGIARALLKFNPELRVTLKKAGHLTRDPREKERKKAGQPGARKRFQFSKR